MKMARPLYQPLAQSFVGLSQKECDLSYHHWSLATPQVKVQPSVSAAWSQSLRQITAQFVTFKWQLYSQRFVSQIPNIPLLTEVLCQNTQLCAQMVNIHIFSAFCGPGSMLMIWVHPHINSLDCEYHPAKQLLLSHFTDEEAWAQRSEVICPSAHTSFDADAMDVAKSDRPRIKSQLHYWQAVHTWQGCHLPEAPFPHL